MRIMNKIYYLIMSMTVILLAACSQDEMEQVKEGTLPELRVIVNHPSSITTRASVNGVATHFEDGDKIGIFAVYEDDYGLRELIYENIPYTCKNVGTENDPQYEWVLADESKKVFYSNKCTYFAYYPYQESLVGDVDSWEDMAVEFFWDVISNWEPRLDQSTLPDFNASDLMVGRGDVNNENASVSFTLEHQMGLVRLDYYDGLNQEYIEDIASLDSRTYFNNEEEENCPIPYNTGKNYFYYIAKPGANMVFWFWGSSFGTFEDYSVDVDESEGFITDLTISPSY